MTKTDMMAQFRAASANEKTIVSLLALSGDALSKTRLLDMLRRLDIRQANGKPHVAATLAEIMTGLRRKGFIADVQGRGFTCADELYMPAIRAALEAGSFESLCRTIDAAMPVNSSYDGFLYLHSYPQALARLRIALLRGLPPEEVYPWLEACGMFFNARKTHPYIEICGRPFEPDLFARLHPALQEEVMGYLLAHAMDEPETAAPLRKWAEERIAQGKPGSVLVGEMAEHLLWCGRLDEASALASGYDNPAAQFVRASMLLLRGAHDNATVAFDAALKALRKMTGRRIAFFPGPCGYLYVLAMMRSSDPKYRKLADAAFASVFRVDGISGLPLYLKLKLLNDVQAGTEKADKALELEKSTGPEMLPQLFQALLYYWLGLSRIESCKPALIALVERAEATGFHLIAAQAAELLHRLDEAGYGKRAAALRKKYGFDDLCGWFERQEQWQRQLSALLALQASAATAPKSNAQSRLVWLLAYEPKWSTVRIEPREQKRDARGNWTKGRAIALRRLREDADRLGFMTPQDMRASAAVRVSASYYGGVGYDIDEEKVLSALIGHPLVFWQDAPETRVELLEGKPELLVKEGKGKVRLSLEPAILPDGRDVLVKKETPTRLRVYCINEEHRRVAAVLGDGLNVPAQAKDQVLQAVGALSSMITVQSDIGGGAADVEQVEADPRLHVHLLPHGEGLRMQILVKPFVDGGPYYAPGQGTANVIAEVAGKPLQTQRDLAAESKAATQLVAACDALAHAEEAHGEWLFDDPQSSLELLMQLQQQAEDIVISWPEGEKFRVGAQLDARQMRLAVKSERDWFAAGGELQIDDGTVLDLRKLLELVRQSPGRFVPLEGNRFLALTEAFHRRLSELAAFGNMHGKGVRVHPLAAFALEDLAADAGSLKADKEWKQHLARLQELDALEPELPRTLQAELRDYQLTGYRWLARLAHWGVGACLADDMGLGKTIQTLALLLARAPQGPALVVAPTSVCTNWMSEISRFAPTLQATLFGSGDRTLDKLQAFDVVVVTYGLLQQEAERFAGIHWHTIVLDEAQAIKNSLTKRSQAVMALNGDFRMVATGTPLENHLGELWNLFRFINPGLLGSLEQFNERFANPIERQRDNTARARLRRLIQPFILRRTKSQVLTELPSRTEIVLPVELSKDEAALYEALRRDALEKLAEDDAPPGQKSLQILAEIMRLRRVCCNPQLVAPELGLASSKLAAFGELLGELLENRHRALVFSQFVDHLALIRAELDKRGVRYQYLDGATPIQERKKRVDAFQSGDGDVFLISLKAGGTGLNLTGADYVIHMDPWWNPAVEDQASDRAHRMGQQRPVTIYRLVARHTIEESIVDLHKHKRDLADSLLEGSDVAGKMSAQEMLGLLRKELG